MKPTWESGDVQLYLGDCLEVMRELPDNSVQCCVTSPPYLTSPPYCGILVI